MTILRALRSVRRRHLVVPAAIAALVLTASVPAWADESWSTTPAPLAAPQRDHRDRERRWYGWQPIVADSLSVTVVPALAFSADRNGGGAAVGLTLASYVLVPPIIHLAHGRPGIAAASLGLRLGLPTAGLFLGASASQNCSGGDFCGLEGAALGFLVGVIAASAIDAAALSWENPASDDEESARNEARRVASKTKAITFTPVGGPRRGGGFDVGVGAIF